MELMLAQTDSFQLVRNLYWEIIDCLEGSEFDPKWRKGIYPSDEQLLLALSKGELYLLYEEGKPIASVIINHICPEGYASAPWHIAAKPDEIMTLHSLGLLPSKQGQGLSKVFLSKIIDHLVSIGTKTIRLDVVKNNLPAIKLYESMGFKYIGTAEIYYEDTGLMEFYLYERVLVAK